jgi:hypothetical protein
MKALPPFIKQHKRLLLIALIALIIMGTAYYFTLGKGTGLGSGSGTGTDGGTSGSSGGRSGVASSFPIKWGVKNSNGVKLQQRLNQSIVQCKTGAKLTEDGVLGDKTLAAIKRSFPKIGLSVEKNKSVAQSEYITIINSKVACV